MNIVVAEDQEMTRSLVVSRLKEWGHAVTDFEDGKAAFQYLICNHDLVDILITDWNMPGLNGVQLAHSVRELTKTSGYVYIVLLTVNNGLEDLIKGFTEGKIDDYLIKPFNATQLRLRLQVGQRIISSERRLHEYSTDLESLVRKQTITLKETQEEIVSRLFSALASRDQETALHVLRIGTMCAYMGQLMGWNPQQIDTLKAAAPLHDIGKIGISDTLLLKPGILTKAEFMQIQQHTTIGAQILSGSRNATIQMGSSIARYHHENWDGSGYPEGLRGDQIPVEAQLVSIVDVYDAMLSDRIYRKAMPEEQVLKYIKDQSRCKFAPKLAKMFLENHAYIKEQCDKDLSRITVPGL